MNHARTWSLCVGVAFLLAIPVHSAAQTQQLSIASFLNAQPPTQVVVWIDPATANVMAYDAFGKRNGALGLGLGTTVEGRVTLRALADGRARVTVVMHTKNAVCWGFASGVPAFGFSPAAVALGSPASLGDALTRIEFNQTSPATPLPTWNQLVSGNPNYTWESVTTTITCEGQLRSGSGFPDGTAGNAHTTQVGLFATGVPSGCPPETDGNCFPSEHVRFTATDN